MKKILFIAFIILAIGSIAYAQMGRGFKGEVTVTNAAQAEELAKQKAAILSGYTTYSAEEVPVRRGTAYKVSAKDGAGNNMFFFVTPFGGVFGPITEDSAKNINDANCFKNGDCMSMGGRGMKGMAGYKQQGEPVIITADQAKNAAEKYLQNLKGYSVESVESFSNRGGKYISYRVYVKDGSGNSFYLHVNPWGNVAGLMSYTRSN